MPPIFMGLIVDPNSLTNGTTADAAQVEAKIDTIYSEFNGSISNANISGSAAIAYSKLNLTGAIVNADLAGSIATTQISGTAVTLSGSQTLTGTKTLAATVQTITAASDGATVTFNLSLGNIHTVTLGGNRTLALSNASTGQAFVVILIQDGTGSRLATWFSGISWPGGVVPTLTTTASKRDVFGFITTATDTYLGFIVGQSL